jgi:hypothetical protein
MANSVDLREALELRDASGSTLGFFLSAQKRKQLEQTCQDLRDECTLLRAQMARIETERDQCLKSLYALTRKPISFDPEELKALESREVDIPQVLQELDQEQEA